jgi:3-hydroxyisobutyrate dehydrogenase-like beta-hydroxyacid dehydrogenase
LAEAVVTVIAIIAQGTMGAGVGRRLAEHGAEVRTLLAGRSAASAARAAAAGMIAAADERGLLAGAEFFLSILPPGEAPALARRLAPVLAALDRKPVYLDCNAVSPQTARRIGAAVAASGARFVDAGIIGGPPQPGTKGPRIYASGEHVGAALALKDRGLDLRPIAGPVGAASALKMSYAGITKGTTAIAAAMLLGAARAGCAEALLAELGASQPQLLAQFRAAIPRMYDKAYRWVAEMEEISAFLEASPAARDVYAAIARLYADLAAAQAEPAPGRDNPVRTLDRVLGD